MVIAEYKKKSTPEESVRNIVMYLRENSNLLKSIKYLVPAEFARDTKRYEDLIGIQLELMEMESYNKSTDCEFQDIAILVDMWKNATKEEVGLILEHLVELLGPYQLKLEADFTREAKLNDLGPQDFDVIFFPKNCNVGGNVKKHVLITGQAEFYECKRNLASFIPDINKEQEIKESNKRKLDFMKRTYDKDRKNFNIYITSLINNSDVQFEYLKEKGYGFVKILNVLDLLKYSS